jgi:hypothetical protein
MGEGWKSGRWGNAIRKGIASSAARIVKRMNFERG